jgi:hypothetical protein
MPANWIPESAVRRRLNVSHAALWSWNKYGSVTIKLILGRRTIRRRLEYGKRGEPFYWARDIARIEEAIKPYSPFTDHRGTWLPWPEVQKRYAWYTHLVHWLHRKGSQWLPKGRKPRRQKFVAHVSRNIGVSFRWFYLQKDLDDINDRIAGAKPADADSALTGDGVTEAEAIASLKIPRSLYQTLLKEDRSKKKNLQIPSWWETRLVERRRQNRIERVALRKRVCSLASLRAALDERRKPTVPAKPFTNPVLPRAAAEKYKDIWNKKWLFRREDTRADPAPLPYTGEIIRTEKRPACIQRARGDNGKSYLAYYPHVKHYDGDQLEKEARLTRAGMTPPAKIRVDTNGNKYREIEPGRVLDEKGRLWDNTKRACCNQKSLQNWAAKGWVKTVEIKRQAHEMGAFRTITYYRVFSNRGYVYVKGLQTGACKRVEWIDSEPDPDNRPDPGEARFDATALSIIANGHVNVPSEAMGRDRQASVVERCPLTLTAPAGPVYIRGREKRPLPAVKFRIIKALVDCWPSGLSRGHLATAGVCSVPHKELKDLCNDPDWDSVIVRPGRGYRNGYRIAGR